MPTISTDSLSAQPSEVSSPTESSSSSLESFEMIDASRSQEVLAGAGSMGPREELRELGSEAEERLKELKEKL